ncbi:MAG TPA: amidohydrolase family protein [Usitatibacter sp.]|nr:amidohydrolase family protein [Usitatibacter sp.]
MKRLAACLASILSLGAPPSFAARTWISDVVIVSPESLDRVEKGGVLLEDGRIVAVERGEAKAPEGAQVVHGGGRFLVPGLIDSHVHLALFPGAIDPSALDPAMVGAYFRQLPRSYLYFGYTTLIDLIVFDKATLEGFRRAPLHPDLHDCGEAVPMANGYPMALFPPGRAYQAFPNFLVDPGQPTPLPEGTKPEEHTPEAAVARVKASGAICVKAFIERGFAKNHALPIPGAGMLARLRKAATGAGLVLVVHANNLEAQRMALDAGVDVIAHGMWEWGALDRSKDVPAEVAAVLDRAAATHTGYQPTFRVLYGESAYFDPSYLDMPALRKVVPAALIEWFKSAPGQQFKKEVAEPGVPDAAMAEGFANGPLRRVRLATAYLDGKGGSLLFGTDTPSAPSYGNLPGLNGYLEMKEWQAAGISLERLFRAATIDNARRFGLDKDVGSIEPGKAANLLLMEKSPLESLDAYDSIVTVWIRGKAVPRESLAANPAPPSRPAAR